MRTLLKTSARRYEASGTAWRWWFRTNGAQAAQRRAWLCVFAAAVLVVFCQLQAPATAQPTGLTSIITPFPENDTYQLHVWGDDLAEGLMTGLVGQLADDPRVIVQRRHRAVGSLMRFDIEEEMKAIEADISRQTAHIVVVMLGVNDRLAWRLPNGRRAGVGSEAWRAEYGRRIDRITRALKARSTAVYWVGLPIMRRNDANEDAQAINEVLRERTRLAGFRYIDAYTATADEDGAYDAFGPDLSGTQRRLRQADGVSLTRDGNSKLAHFVAREIRRDLVQARAQRAVPLAGGEAEQRLIRPLRVTPPPSAKGTPAPSGRTAATAPAAVSDGQSDAGLAADSGRVRVGDTRPGRRGDAADALDLPRPAISPALLSVLRRRVPDEAARTANETLSRVLPGGFAATQTLLGSAADGGARRTVLPSQTPYFRVLVKGERLEPKPGRADDFMPAQPARGPAQPASDQGRESDGKR